MINKISRLSTACLLALLAFQAGALLGQGTPRQEYSGLDKYLSQGIPKDNSFVGVRAAEFLTIPVGARGIGLGGAYSAICDDISSIWWNPAGLGLLENREVMVTVVDYTMDLTYSYAAFASPVLDGRMSVGGFFGMLNVPETEITTIESPNGTGRYYTAYDFQMGGSFAYNVTDRFVAGINAKYIHQDVFSNISGNAFAIDGGGIYHTELFNKEIRFAFTVQNLGTNITMHGSNLLYNVGAQDRSGIFPTDREDFSSDIFAVSPRDSREVYLRTNTFRLPTVVKLAVAYNLLTGEKVNWLASTEYWRANYIPTSYTAGTELTYNLSPFLSASMRTGWNITTDEYTRNKDDFGYSYYGDDPTFRGLSFGGGMKRVFGSHFIEFNYAYQNRGRLSANNFFTLSLGF